MRFNFIMPGIFCGIQNSNPTWRYCLLIEIRGYVNETIFLKSL